MGILDEIQFDPRFYDSSVQGLLSQINPMQLGQSINTSLQQQPGAPSPFAPIPQQQNGPHDVVGSLGSSIPVPTFGTAPDPAQLPQNAKPVEQPAPLAMSPPPQTPGIGDRAALGAKGFLGNLAGGPIGAVLGGLGAAITGQPTDAAGIAQQKLQQQNNATTAALQQKGVDPAVIKASLTNPDLMKALVTQHFGSQSTNDIKEYQFAKTEDPSLTFEKFMAKKKSVSGEYGMTPIWGVDAQGNPAIVQLGKAGDAKQAVLPPGFKISRDGLKVDGPTGTTILDPQTRQPVQFIPKDVAGAASQREQGESQGKAAAALPVTLNAAQTSIDLIDEMIKHPGRAAATGMSRWADPRNYLAGTDATNFAVRAKQVEGRTFLAAFDQLRGAGAITEAEGRQATSAQARLDRSQSDEEYLAALHELQGILRKGMEIARQKAGVGGAPASGGAPAAGNYVWTPGTGLVGGK